MVEDTMEVAGVNDRAQLAVAEAELRDRINERWMRRGVTMWDPERTYIDVDVVLEPDVVLLPGVILQGSCVIGTHAEIGPEAHLVDTVVGRGCRGGLQRLPPVGRSGPTPGSGPSPCWTRGPRCRPGRRGPGPGRPVRPGGSGPAQAPVAEAGSATRDVGDRRRRAVASWVWNSPPAAASNWCPAARTRSWPGTSPPAGGELGEANLREFANGEIHCRFDTSIRGSDVFIIQTHCGPVNDSLMEHLIMIDAAKRASAKRITAVCPYYGYSRQDRKAIGREPITAKLVADMLSVAGADRVVSVDLHSGQIQGFFDVPFDHLTAAPVLVDYLRTQRSDDLVVVAPDAGRVKVAERFSQHLTADLAVVHKRRLRGEPTRWRRCTWWATSRVASACSSTT